MPDWSIIIIATSASVLSASVDQPEINRKIIYAGKVIHRNKWVCA